MVHVSNSKSTDSRVKASVHEVALLVVEARLPRGFMGRKALSAGPSAKGLFSEVHCGHKMPASSQECPWGNPQQPLPVEATRIQYLKELSPSGLEIIDIHRFVNVLVPPRPSIIEVQKAFPHACR